MSRIIRFALKIFGLSALAARASRVVGLETVEADDEPLPLYVELELHLTMIAQFVREGASDKTIEQLSRVQMRRIPSMLKEFGRAEDRAAIQVFEAAIDFCLQQIDAQEFERVVFLYTRRHRPIEQVEKLIELFPFLREKILLRIPV